MRCRQGPIQVNWNIARFANYGGICRLHNACRNFARACSCDFRQSLPHSLLAGIGDLPRNLPASGLQPCIFSRYLPFQRRLYGLRTCGFGRRQFTGGYPRPVANILQVTLNSRNTLLLRFLHQRRGFAFSQSIPHRKNARFSNAA